MRILHSRWTFWIALISVIVILILGSIGTIAGLGYLYVRGISQMESGLIPEGDNIEGRIPRFQWTPDGSRAVFSVNGIIFEASADGSSVRAIHAPETEDIEDLYHAPSLSPDGSMLAYFKYRHDGFWGVSHNWKIATSALDGSNEQVIADPDDRYISVFFDLAWSPDGSRIGYLFADVIYTMAADGSDQRPVIDVRESVSGPSSMSAGGPPGRAEPPCGRSSYDNAPRPGVRVSNPPVWSQDWTRLAFTAICNRNGRRAVYTVNIDGTGLKKIADFADDPAWSPDGSRLAFVTHRWHNERGALPPYTLRTIRSDGSDPREVATLSDAPGRLGDLSWSPDSSQILLYLSVIPLDGFGVKELPGQPPGVKRTGWVPDGSRIVVLASKHRRKSWWNSSILYTVFTDGSDIQVMAVIDEKRRAVAGQDIDLEKEWQVFGEQ